MLCSRETRLLALCITTLIQFIPTSLVSYMKKEIMVIYSIMQEADEKLIINALGSYMAITSSQAGQVRPEQFYADQTCT